ncbi:hypothetical protein Y696_12505 [Mesotoga sp. H07pep.5.4]|nr:hypothetical protein Y696_12505 [Mesotoga sp. H07pep.5.4]
MVLRSDATRPGSWFFGTRSRNKFGMTADGFSERARCCHSDKATGRNLDALASRFFSANGEPLNGQPVPLLFPTTNPLTQTTVSQKPRS